MEGLLKFRDYQSSIMDRAVDILKKSNFVYLAMEVRTGKTLTSLGAIDKMGVESALFLTKKKAISSIEGDYKKLNNPYRKVGRSCMR